MKKILVALSLTLFFISCEKESFNLQYINVENVEWFKELKTPCDEPTICKLRINKGLFAGDTIYFTTYVGALCDMYFTASLINIHGDTLKNYSGPDDFDNFNNEVQFIETIYRCEDE